MDYNYPKEQARANWYLDALHEEFLQAKPRLNPDKNKIKITDNEYYYICALLCNLSPQKIAIIFYGNNDECMTDSRYVRVRNDLTEIYRYAEEIILIKTDDSVTVNHHNFSLWMKDLGFKKDYSPKSKIKKSKRKSNS